MESLAGQIAQSDTGIRVRWDERVRSGDVDPDLPYVAMGTLATLVVDAVADEPAIDLSNLFGDLEGRLTEALPAARNLLIVGFLETLQNVSLNQGVSLDSWLRSLGPATREAWSMIEGMWSGSIPPEQFNDYVGRATQPPFRTAHVRTEIDFGCDYCRDDQNRLFGHVTQIASSEVRHTILLRCPRCGALYENAPSGPDRTRRITEAEADRLFRPRSAD